MTTPPYDEKQGGFVCECGAPEAALFRHPDDEHTLVCAASGTRYDTPEEGPWTFTVAA